MAGVKPEPEGEPEPEVEPEPKPESEMEPYIPMNNSNTILEKTLDDEPQAFAEPVPKWDEALPEYGWAWDFHIYFVGTAFALLALYSLISLVRLRKKRLLSRGYFLALNAVLLILGIDRAVYMFVDAYNHKSIFPLSVAYLLLGMGFPCLTSAFSILFLALLQSTKIQLVPPKIQKPSFLTAIIIIHFLISFVSDILLGFFAQTFALTLVCQVSFILWGLFLSISFMIIFRRLYRSTTRLHRESVRLSLSKRSLSMRANSMTAPKVRIPKNSWGNAIKLTLAIAFLGSMTALLQLYGIVVVYGPVGGKIPAPWPWWAYQFTFRLVELAMCVIMSYVATQPFRYTRDGQEKDCTICCGVFMKKKEEEEDESEYWAKYFEAAPPETFLPKMNGSKGNSSNAETQTAWKDNTNVNDMSVHESNSLKKLLNKNKRFKLKGLTKTYSVTDLYHYDPEQVKVTSASFSSFGMFFAQSDSVQVVHNDLASPRDRKNKNMNANPQSEPTSPLLLTNTPFDVKGQAEIQLSPVDVNAPLLRSETSL